MTTYSHSGSLGDLIYSLPVIKKVGTGDFRVNLRGVHKVSAAYGYNVDIIPEYHQQMITEQSYNWLKPLLEYQPYIDTVTSGEYEDDNADVKLDAFRGVLWRSFTGNYVEGYYKTFNLTYTAEDITNPWLTSPTKRIAKYIVTRTPRYTDESPESIAQWTSILNAVKDDCCFVGLLDEHNAFQDTFGVNLPLYMNEDFLDLASVINGADQVISNQTFVYSLATGLGKPTILESWKLRPLAQNECYFNRSNAQYF